MLTQVSRLVRTKCSFPCCLTPLITRIFVFVEIFAWWAIVISLGKWFGLSTLDLLTNQSFMLLMTNWKLKSHRLPMRLEINLKTNFCTNCYGTLCWKSHTSAQLWKLQSYYHESLGVSVTYTKIWCHTKINCSYHKNLILCM